MDRIRIKPHFSVVVHEANMVELRQGVWNSISHIMHDENKENFLAKIITDLQAGISPQLIAEKLSISRSKVEAVIDHLQKLGVLQNGSESFLEYYLEQVVPMFRRHGYSTPAFAMPLILVGDDFLTQSLSHHLTSFFEINIIHSNLWSLVINSDEDWLFDAMCQEKFVNQFDEWKNKFVVYLSAHLHPIHATKINKIAKLLNISWLHLTIDGPFLLIGPTFQPRQGPCYDCFETRIHMNLRESESYQRYKNQLALQQVYFSENDPLQKLMASLVIAHGTFEIVNYLATQCTFTTNKVLSIFLPTMEFIYHDVMRFPTCRTCGSVPQRDETQLYFDFQQLIGN